MSRRPPGPPGKWLAGNLEDYELDRLGFMLSTRDRYGEIVSFDRATTIVHGPELATKVLLERSGTFEVQHNLLLERIPPDDLGAWISARRLLNPGLRRNAVASVGTHTATLAKACVEALGGEPVDAVRFFEGITSSVVARHFFGEDVGEIPTLAGRLLTALNAVIGNPFALPTSWATPARRRIHFQLGLLEREVEERLWDRARHPGGFNDLAAHVVAARTESQGETLGRISRLLVGALLAAHRVPAAAAGWVMMLVASNADLMTSLRSEAVASSSERGISPRRSGLTLARAVILEALRLYPPTWLISRTTTRPIELDGYQLRAGHTVLISPYVIHRDERLFADASSFEPGRWLTETNPAPFLAFGLGARACPGSNFGLASLSGLLTTLVSGFRIVQEVGEVRANPRTSLTPDGLRLRFISL
jgi:cytochrome P450